MATPRVPRSNAPTTISPNIRCTSGLERATLSGSDTSVNKERTLEKFLRASLATFHSMSRNSHRGFIRQSIELGISPAQGLFSSWQVKGTGTADDACGSYSLWNLPCTCRDIFSTSGYPHHGKAVEAQGIGKLNHDVGPTGDGVRLIVRKANARTLNYNHAGMESSGNFVHCRTMPFKA